MKKIFLIFVLLGLLSCERDNIEAGKETKVSGKLTEYYGDPIPNVKLKIGEFTDKFVVDGGTTSVFKKWIDSTYTNQNGEYNINFKTTGNGTHYKLFVEPSPITEQKFWNCCIGTIDITNIGGNFTLNNNQLLNLYPCDVTINLNNISVFPLTVQHATTIFQDSYVINNNNTAIKRIYIAKDFPQTLEIYRTKLDGKHQKAKFTFPASQTTTATSQTITVNEIDFVDL